MKRKTARMLNRILIVITFILLLIMGITRIMVFGYAAIGTAVAVGVISKAFCRCPHCGEFIGQMHIFKDDEKYCRFCGKDLDI